VAREEPQQAAEEGQEEEGQEEVTGLSEPRSLLEEHAPWLLDPDLGLCAVGSVALAEACRRVGVAAPEANDLDLSWALDPEAGTALLEDKGVLQPTTDANRDRGTLALRLGTERIEITSFRGDRCLDASSSMEDRIAADLDGRDMTVCALALWLAEDRILYPLGGLDDWREGRVVAVGDPEQRIREHPVRWLRYYRRAHQWGFDLDRKIRNLSLDASILDAVPREAIAAEIRAALLMCCSPGSFLMELSEIGVLESIAPELALQFDGRAAGPLRYHPEVSQGLHLILSLEWLRAHTTHLPDDDKLMAAVAVLCHDMGKGFTEPGVLPAHPGHERVGVRHVRKLLRRLPGLADTATRRLAEAVCALHTVVRGLENVRPGTRAKLYERWFRTKEFRVDLFALAVGADVGGRLDMATAGEEAARKVERDLNFLRESCGKVDVGSLWKQHRDDKERFRAERHQAFARALRNWEP
jgi:tRNA nucleotidyltransferase (CCA-adding enzyme)